ncbi:MAG: DeoR family transcriptional regulator [Methanobacteriaceae archaeon]|jgi:Fic family protein|nr:DeoR family transcriptional regulator [Methanobacteriaceae archaeon]
MSLFSKFDYNCYSGYNIERDHTDPLYSSQIEISLNKINNGKNQDAINSAILKLKNIDTGSLEEKNDKFTEISQNGDLFKIIFYNRTNDEMKNVLSTKSNTINLKDIGLNEHQISALELMVNSNETFSINKYMDFFKVSRPTASKDLNFLFKEGLIFKFPSKNNKSKIIYSHKKE